MRHLCVHYKSEVVMYTATGSRITVAIGVLALSLAAITPAISLGRRTSQAGEEGETSRHRNAQAHSPQKQPLKNSPRQRPQEKLHPVPVRRQHWTSSPPTKGKPETKSPSPEPTSARQPVYEVSRSAQVTRLSFARRTTASQRPCQAVEKKAWFSSPSPPPREKTHDRFL